MRKRNKRSSGPAKQAAHLNVGRRQGPKKNAAPKTPNVPKLELPIVEAPPSQQVTPRQPLPYWAAIPIAMMRLWLGSRDSVVRK
jgi:hypothetical protein